MSPRRMIHLGRGPKRGDEFPPEDPPPELGTITNLSAVRLSATSVGLSWTDADNATSHQPQYREVGSGTWLNFGSALGLGASPVEVTGLTTDVPYEFQIAASDGSTTTQSNTATATPSEGVSILFSSDWGTAASPTQVYETTEDSSLTAEREVALSDGGLWNDHNFCWDSKHLTLNVVPGGPLGWTRTANVLRLTMRGDQGCGNVQLNPSPIPASTTHWGRFWFRNDERSNMNMHPVTYNASGSIQAVPWSRGGQSGGVIIGMNSWTLADGSPAPYNYTVWAAGSPGNGYVLLAHDTWFRFEWMLEYLTADTYRIWPRIYNMAGDLLHDASSYYWRDSTGQSNETLAVFYAGGGAYRFGDVQLARRFGFGNEGPGMATFSGEHWYHADCAISLEGWIGDQ